MGHVCWIGEGGLLTELRQQKQEPLVAKGRSHPPWSTPSPSPPNHGSTNQTATADDDDNQGKPGRHDHRRPLRRTAPTTRFFCNTAFIQPASIFLFATSAYLHIPQPVTIPTPTPTPTPIDTSDSYFQPPKRARKTTPSRPLHPLIGQIMCAYICL